MLVKFFQYGAVKKGQKGHSGGGGAVKNYLLGKDYDKGVIRDGATLFRGDPNETTSIINGIERQSYYKSLVLSFTESDSKKLDDNKLNEIIDDFNATMFPTFNESQYSGYWVKHMDKGRIELHGVYAEEELTSGYGLNVYVATVDKPLVDSWKDLINDKYDLDDPNAPMHKRARAITKGFELKKGYEPKKTKIADEELKNQIEKELLEYVNNHPEITNRDGIISAFEELDYKVERTGKNYISIEHPNKKDNPELKNLRFKSDIYSQDFNRSMLSKNKSYEQREYERKRPERIAKAQKIYDSSLQKRIERMTHRYRNIERKPLDNQLTHDLKQIQAKSEPNFLKQVAEYQRQQLKDIIGQSIEQIYKQHEHDRPEQLESLKNLHQTLLDSIDNQVKDEPLPQFDQIIEQYTNAKNHVVTVDTIEHDRHQAQLEQQQAEIVVPTVRLSLAEQRAKNRERKGQDELTPEQRVAKSFAEQRAKAQTAPPRQSTVVPQPTYAERMRISERMAELMQFDSLDPERIPQSFIDDLSQHEPSRLDYTHNHYSDVIKKSYEIIQERDLTDTEKDNHKTAVFFSRAIDRVKQLASAIKEKFTAKATEPEPVAEILRSDEEVAQLTPDLSPKQAKQAKLLALMQQNQESERQAKLEQQQAQREREERQARRQAQLEALKNKQPEPPLEREQLEQPQTRITETPEPSPPMVTLDEIVNKNSPKLKSYIGEVVEIDPKKGIYQKVGDRLVLHTIISNNAQVGKWSRIDYKEDGQIQVSDGSAYDMSRFKTSDRDKTKTQDQNQGR